jgi:glycosyltransferase involved in cell wall biosynthesis
MLQKRRILVVSHACVNPLSQQLYAEVQRLTGWHFTILLPAIWKDEFGNRLRPAVLPGFSVDLVTAPVWLNGNIILHGYRFDFRRFLGGGKLDLIYVNHEPYAVATAQICWANLHSAKLPFGFYSCQNIYKQYPPPFRWTERMVYRSSSFAFPITDAVDEVLINKGFQGESTVCPLPFDPTRYRPYAPDQYPKTLIKSDSEVLIGYAGRIVEQKGLRTLVEAVRRLPQNGWRLVMIGDGPFAPELDRLLQSMKLSDRVIRLGYVPHGEIPQYLAALDVLVLPSETQPNWKEQFGRVIIEALACGTPVVGSDSGEIPKLLSLSEGGITFPERDVQALADALRQMIQNRRLREEFAGKGRSWALRHVSLNAVAEKMAATMDRAACANSNQLLAGKARSLNGSQR